MLTSYVDELKKSLKDINKQQIMIAKMILNIDGSLIRMIENPTDDMLLTAVKQNGMVIQHIIPLKQTYEIKNAALKNNPFCFGFIHEPTFGMGLNVIETPYPDEEDDDYNPDLEKLHPVHFVKKMEITDHQRLTLYKHFIDANPNFTDEIVEDISNDPNECEIWKYAMTHHTNIDYGKSPKLPPSHVMEKILDEVMVENVRALEAAPCEMWTFERLSKYVETKPSLIHTALSMFDKSTQTTTHVPGELIKIAFENSGEPGFKNCIAMMCENWNRDVFLSFETFKIIMEAENAISILGKLGCGWIRNTEEKVLYIFNRFKLEDIVDNVDSYVIDQMLSRLKMIDKIKYKLKIYRCKHRKSKHVNDNTIIW